MDQVVITKLEEWESLVKRVIRLCFDLGKTNEGATVVVLTGDLGAGKTTFSQAAARVLGVSEVVQSPTYTIMKSYKTTDTTFKWFVHMDAYRLENESELTPLRFAELLKQPQTLVFIEWGERIENVLPSPLFYVTINHQQDDIRVVSVEQK